MSKLLFCARRTLIKIHSKIYENCSLCEKVGARSTIKFMAVLVSVIVRLNNCFRCCKWRRCSLWNGVGLWCCDLVSWIRGYVFTGRCLRQRGKYQVRILLHWKMKCNYRVVLGTRRAEQASHPPKYRYFYSHFTFFAGLIAEVGLRFRVSSVFRLLSLSVWRSPYFRRDWSLRSNVMVMHTYYTHPCVIDQGCLLLTVGHLCLFQRAL